MLIVFIVICIKKSFKSKIAPASLDTNNSKKINCTRISCESQNDLYDTVCVNNNTNRIHQNQVYGSVDSINSNSSKNSISSNSTTNSMSSNSSTNSVPSNYNNLDI